MSTDTKANDVLHFCVVCFATNEGGSWGEGVILDGGHCMNCGAGGCTVAVPRWAVEQIRRNGSWVCKRYYPADEDRERAEERRALLSVAPPSHGRFAEVPVDGEIAEKGYWRVVQPFGDGRTVWTLVKAATAADALEAARDSLVYVAPPKEPLDE